MTKTLRLAVAFLALASTAATAACGGGSGSGANTKPKATINIGYFPVISPVPIMRQQRLLERAGYKVHWVQVTSGLPGAASALAAGKLDMAYGNSDSGTVTFSQSPDTAQFVGQSFTNENVTVVSNKINDYSRLARQKVAVSGLRTASTLFYQMGLKSHGIDPRSDHYFVSGTGPGMVGVMASGDATVAASYVPYSAEMVIRGLGHVLFSADDALGEPAPGDGFIARTAFIKKHPDAVIAVLKAQFAATDFIKENRSSAYKTLARFAKVDEPAVAYSFDHHMIGIAATYVPDADGIAKVMGVAQKLGFAPRGVDLPSFARKFVNTSLARKALGGS